MMRTRVSLCLLAALVAMAGMPAALASQLSPDPSFSSDGKRPIEESRQSSVESVDVSGGDIYAVSLYYYRQSPTVLLVSRTADDGTMDDSFGGDGKVFVKPRNQSFLNAGFAVEDSGATVVVGQSRRGLTVVRFRPSGRYDASFSGDGVRRLQRNAQQTAPPDVVIDSQGRLIVAAMVKTKVVAQSGKTKFGSDVWIYRLLPSGALDSTFAGDGIRRIDNDRWDWMDAVTVDSENRVVLGTDSIASGNSDAPGVLMRFRRNGTRDSSFSGDGLMHFRVLPRELAFPVALGVGSSGQITAAVTSQNAYGAIRVRDDGVLSQNYGDDGVLGLTCDCVIRAADVSDGGVLLSGETTGGETLVTRIGADGTTLAQGRLDLFPATQFESVGAVTFSGSKTVIGGTAFENAFLARVE